MVRGTRLVNRIHFLAQVWSVGVDLSWWKGWVWLWRVLWSGDKWVLAETQSSFAGSRGQRKPKVGQTKRDKEVDLGPLLFWRPHSIRKWDVA